MKQYYLKSIGPAQKTLIVILKWAWEVGGGCWACLNVFSIVQDTRVENQVALDAM